jgi:hypothetical protein
MTFDRERLYELLPAIHRIRDKEQGEPLKALLSVIADQVAILEEDLAQLYDDQFIETSAPWVAPYIGDLIGIKGLRGSGTQNITPRAEVAHTIGYRRRKGTAAVLEQLARDVTGWPARAVEFFQILATTQYLNHLRPENRSFISVREANRLEYLGSAFEHLEGGEDLAHTVDVRRIASGRGRYNIPNVGLFLWRLQANPATGWPAVPASPGDKRRFHFSPLANDSQLFNHPVTEDEITHLAEPINVPDRISRRVLNRNLEDYYGDDKSILLNVAGDDIIPDPNNPLQKLSDLISVCDLTDWAHEPSAKIAIDPVLGRVAFPSDLAAPPLVNFYYGFSAKMGGGEYDRVASFDVQLKPDQLNAPAVTIKKVANTHSEQYSSIQAALDALGDGPAIIEITDSGRYEETINIDATNRRIELRAADQRRPTLILSGSLQITGGDDDTVSINGLLITGGSLNVSGRLSRFRLRHCTLVPGITISADGTPSSPLTPSLIIKSNGTDVEIDHSISGAVRAVREARVRVFNSIIDATEITGVAYADDDNESAGGTLQIENSTVIGKVHTGLMEMASNTIFMSNRSNSDDRAKWPSALVVQRRQEGCARFSYLPAGALVPRRFQCQPQSDADADRVRPIFASLRYGDPEYCQLRPDCPVEIRQGADDESEMGAFHDLYQPQREAHLRTRLNEYLRFGLEAGIFYAT